VDTRQGDTLDVMSIIRQRFAWRFAMRREKMDTDLREHAEAC
jgi:hypothetical protein